ncbi:MAG TPA: hexose kinase [Planctomycetota bacterium]|nr:hexose kinase [Planctomycetota bacterium]HRR80789.1 hexose kinase [Planctomycetota bacterium]HRT94051.1 hexose kinase [Planctomycetota bacterium]
MTVITVTPNTSVDRTLEVPGLTLGGHLQGRLVRLQPGGKGVNVARCLAALGVPSVVTGLVGAAELALFRESFAPMPVAVELVPVAAPTRTCTTLLDPERGTDTHIREQGACVTPDEIGALHAKLAALASPDALVVFCGSLPPGMSGAHLEALLAACRERGAPVAADLNGSALSRALAAHPLLIKPNVEELGECLGRRLAEASDAELLEATRSLLDRVGTVLLTRGRRGALAVSAVRALACAVAIPHARNTVGCGDAFLAGYLAGMVRGAPMGEALRLAVACGAAQASSDAAGRITAGQVAELAPKAEVRAIQ